MLKIVTILTAFLFALTSHAQPAESSYVCPPCDTACDSKTFVKPGKCDVCNMDLITKEKREREIIEASKGKKRIAFYLQYGVEVLDFAGPMEVFAYAGYEVFTVSKNKTPIISQGILKIIPDYSIEDAPSADILAFFGGNSDEASKDPEVINWVKSQKNIEYYFSVCTGAFILAESGILKDKSATTFHGALDNFEQSYPEINVLKNVRFVDNGKIITTAGISAGIDGALHLVAKLNGFNVARKAAYYMEYDKWIPGEGLLLSEDNPYKDFTDIDKLEAYVGVYEYLDDSQIEIKINENEKSLFAIVDTRKYPLFYHKNDTFSNINDDKIIFERKRNHSINGFKSNKYGDKLFIKLN